MADTDNLYAQIKPDEDEDKIQTTVSDVTPTEKKLKEDNLENAYIDFPNNIYGAHIDRSDAPKLFFQQSDEYKDSKVQETIESFDKKNLSNPINYPNNYGEMDEKEKENYESLIAKAAETGDWTFLAERKQGEDHRAAFETWWHTAPRHPGVWYGVAFENAEERKRFELLREDIRTSSLWDLEESPDKYPNHPYWKWMKETGRLDIFLERQRAEALKKDKREDFFKTYRAGGRGGLSVIPNKINGVEVEQLSIEEIEDYLWEWGDVGVTDIPEGYKKIRYSLDNAFIQEAYNNPNNLYHDYYGDAKDEELAISRITNKRIEQDNEHIVQGKSRVSFNGLSNDVDYSKGNHTILIKDMYDNEVEVVIKAIPAKGNYLVRDDDSGDMVPVEVGDENALFDKDNFGYTKQGKVFIANPTPNNVKGRDKDAPENRIANWDKLTDEAKDKYESEWEDALKRYDNLIEEYNDPDTTKERKRDLLHTINRFVLVNQGDVGDGIWIPKDSTEEEYDLHWNATKGIYIDGEAYPPIYLRNRDDGVVIDEISSDGVTFTMRDPKSGRTEIVNIYDMINGLYDVEDMSAWYNAANSKLPRTFIYNDYMSLGDQYSNIFGREEIEPHTFVSGGYEEWVQNNVLLNAILDTDPKSESYDTVRGKGDNVGARIYRRENTSIDKGILKWTRPETLSDGSTIDIDIDSIAHYAGVVVDSSTDKDGNTIWNLSRPDGYDGQLDNFMVTAHFTDGTTSEANNQELQSVLDIQSEINKLREWAGRGVDLDSSDFVSPYEYEDRVKAIESKITAHNVLFGNKDFTHVNMLYSNLIDAYFDKSEDYQVVHPSRAYQIYKAAESQGIDDPLTERDESQAAFLMSEEEYYAYMGWDESTIKNGFKPSDLRAGNYNYEYVTTVADVKEHARFMRAVKFHSMASGYDTIMDANEKWVEDTAGGEISLSGMLGTEEYTRSGQDYSKVMRDWEANKVELYKDIIFDGKPKQKEEMWALGGISFSEAAMMQTFDDYNHFTFQDIFKTMGDFMNTPLTTTVHNWFASDENKQLVNQLPLIQAYFNEHIIPYPDEVQQYWEDLENKGLMPIEMSKASPNTKQKVLKFFTSFGAASESVLTPTNILLMFGGVGLIKKLGNVPKYGALLQSAVTTAFGTTMFMGAWSNLKEALVHFENNDDDAGYEALGNMTVDAIFGLIGARGAWKFGKQGASQMHTRIQDYKAAVKDAVDLSAPHSHKTATEIINLGGEKFYVKELLAQPKGRDFLTKMLKDGKLPSEVNTKALLLEYKAQKLSELNKAEIKRRVAEAEAKAGRKFNADEKRAFIEKTRSDIRKKIYDEGIPDAEMNIHLESITSYNRICQQLTAEFLMDKKFPTKTNYDFQKFLDGKFELWGDNFTFKGWTSKDINLFRKHIGNNLKNVKNTMEATIKAEGDVVPWIIDYKGGEPLTKVKGKLDEKYDYSGNIDLSRFPKELHSAIRGLGRYIGKEVNDNIRFKGNKWSDIDKAALEPKTIERVLQKIANRDSYSTYSITEFRTLSHLLEGNMRNYINNYSKRTGVENEAQLKLLEEIYNARTGTLSEAASILNISKMNVDPSTDYMIRNYIGQKNMGSELLSKLHDTSVNTGLTTTYKLMAGLAEVGRNTKLMNLASVIRSTVGNTSHLFITGAERPLAVFYDKLFTSLDRGFRGTASWVYKKLGKEPADWMKVNAKQGRFIVEELAFWNNYVRAYGGKTIGHGNTVYRNVWEIMKENPDVLKNDAFFLRERFDIEGIIPKAWGGTFLRSPQNIQAGIDIMIRQPAELAFLHKHITRRVLQEGHKWGTKNYNKRYNEILENPSKEDLRLAKESAEYITFQSELKGFDAMINKLRTGAGHTGGGLGESTTRASGNPWAQGFNTLFMPFFNTPINIFKAVYHRTPMAQVFSRKAIQGFQKGYKTGDWSMYADVTSQVTTGTLLLSQTHHIMDNIFGGEYGDKWVVEDDWQGLSKAEVDEKLAAGFKPNTIRYKDDNGNWVSTYMSGWEPMSSFMYMIGGMQNGNPDAGAVEQMMGAYKAFYKEYMNNPFMQGVPQATDLMKGESDALGWGLKTLRGIFMPNFMAQAQQINDPYYLMTPEYNNYKDGIFNDKGVYTAHQDNRIFEEKLYKHLKSVATMGLDDKSAKSILENAKQVVESERDKIIQKSIDDYGYSLEKATKLAGEIPDLILARPFFNDYAMNLPKLDMYGFPVERMVGETGLLHFSGIKQYSQEGKQPYWKLPERYDELLSQEKYWSQILNLVYDESMRLQLNDRSTDFKSLVGIGKMNRVDEYLVNASIGQYKLLNMIDNMVMVPTGEYDTDTGHEIRELSLDKNGNIMLAPNWSNSLDGEKLQKVDFVENGAVEIIKTQIGMYLLEQQKEYYSNWDEVQLELSSKYAPKNVYMDLVRELKAKDPEYIETGQASGDEFGGKSFKVFYKDKRYGSYEIMLDNAEINAAYDNWKKYYMLKNLKDEDDKLVFKGTYDKLEYDARTNYEAIYRDAQNEYLKENFPGIPVRYRE